MRVVAVNTREDRAIVSRQFQVHSDPDYCTMHLVNDGVTVANDNVTIEFAVVGPAEGVTCQLDGQPPFSCEQYPFVHINDYIVKCLTFLHNLITQVKGR